MKLFTLNSSRDFTELVAGELQMSLSAHEERSFEDGEHKTRPLESVSNEDVFVVHSLYGDAQESVNDKFCRLLFFISTLKDAGAARVTAVVPYLCYSRKDRRTKSRDPVTTRYIAQLFEASGADDLLTLDVHNLQAFQNAFRMKAQNLEAKNLFAGYLLPLLKGKDIVVMSPDFGGVKRAELFMESLSEKLVQEVSFSVMEKYRSSGKIWGEKIAGEVNNKTVLIVDDLVSTGGTIIRTAEACKKSGAVEVIAIVTHGLFTGAAATTLNNPALDQIIITNTVPPFRLEHSSVTEKLIVLNAAPLFAEAIQNMHTGSATLQLHKYQENAGTF